MKNQKTLLSILLLLLSAYIPRATAADVGIGFMSYTFGYNFMFGFTIPIRMPGLSIEPEIGFRSESEETENNLNPSAPALESEERYITYGIGIFGRSPISNSAETYYGARIGFFDSEDENEYTSGTAKYEESGFYLIPTVGVEYLFSQRFSIGVDIGLQYTEYEEDYTVTNTSGTVTTDETTEENDTTTVGRIMFRAYF